MLRVIFLRLYIQLYPKSHILKLNKFCLKHSCHIGLLCFYNSYQLPDKNYVITVRAEAQGYIESYEDVMKFEEEMLAYAIGKLKEKYGEEIKEAFGEELVVPTLPFPRIKLADLYAELEERYGLKVPDSEKGDLTTEAERMCKEYAKEKYGHEFLFVTDFSVEKRPFYHMRKDGVPQGYDLIWKGCEITTGAQREHRYDILKAQAQEKGLEEDVKFYLEFFKYGCPPHGGFGIGVDRMTMLMFNVGFFVPRLINMLPCRLSNIDVFICSILYIFK